MPVVIYNERWEYLIITQYSLLFSFEIENDYAKGKKEIKRKKDRQRNTEKERKGNGLSGKEE